MANIRVRTNSKGARSWQVRIKYTRHGTQQTETRTFSAPQFSRNDAKAWAREREAQLIEGESITEQDRTITLGDLTARYIQEYEKDAKWGKTKANDLRLLMKRSIAKRPVIDLKARDFIEHIRLRREGGVSASTANNDLIWWRTIYKIAIGAWDFPLSTDAIESAAVVCRQHRLIAKPNKRDRRPSLDELESILRHATRGDGRQQIPLSEIILFQIFSARRIAETCRLEWDDYDRENATVLVRDMKDPRNKDGNHITVSLPPQAIAIIDRQPTGRPYDRFIFPYNGRSVGSLFNRACKLTGVKNLRLHDLRHEGTSWLFETGLDIPRVSKVTGHRSWGGLQRYAHIEGLEHKDKYEGWIWLRSANPARLTVV